MAQLLRKPRKAKAKGAKGEVPATDPEIELEEEFFPEELRAEDVAYEPLRYESS